MQAVCCAVKTNIGRDDAGGCMRINRTQISCLMDVATLAENLDKVRFMGHLNAFCWDFGYASGSKSESRSAPSTSVASRYVDTCVIIGSR